MNTLKEWISWAEENKVAIGHFNVSTLEMFHGVLDGVRRAGDELGVTIPVCIGVSEGEREWMGTHQVSALVQSVKEGDIPVFQNADHTYSVEKVKEAIDAGFDMVIYDDAKGSYEDNVAKTKECVAYARASGREVLVESELGYIGSGSDLKDEVPEGTEAKTEPDDARKFVEDTEVDLLAPAVGNIHGMVKGGNPHIDPKRVAEIREAAGVPLVLHGGSGISDEDFVAGISAGISMVHISTELRVAFREGLVWSLNEGQDIAPYKYMKEGRDAVAEVVYKRVKLFMSNFKK